MKIGLSPHANTLIELVDNVRSLIRHHKYVEARDVMRALQIMGKDFGFEIPGDMIDDMIDDIGRMTPLAIASQLDSFSNFIMGLDHKLDNETLTGEQHGRPNITRLRSSP